MMLASKGERQQAGKGAPTQHEEETAGPKKLPRLVDIGINITNRALIKHWEEIIQRAIDAGVHTILLTGTNLRSSKESLAIARSWSKNHGDRKNLLCTVGVHPHDAKAFVGGSSGSSSREKAGRGGVDASTIDQMRNLLQDEPFAVAIGECGLDYNRNFSRQEDQLLAFREQVRLACDLQLPLFVHEREAHKDLIKVLDEAHSDKALPPLPPVVVHCFTGTLEEAQAYLERGFYIGFTGVICKKERGEPLRAILPEIPLERIMLETDAPWMGFMKGRQRHSEPAHVVGVAEQVSRTLRIPFEEVCSVTTKNAENFFGITRE